MIAPAEMNLDELRAALAPALPGHAAFDGWSDEALAMAAAELGVPPERARLAFKGGQAQMIDAWFDWIDKAMLEAFPPERIAAMKIRDRIRELVLMGLITITAVLATFFGTASALAMDRMRPRIRALFEIFTYVAIIVPGIVRKRFRNSVKTFEPRAASDES